MEAGNIIEEMDKLFKDAPGYDGIKATIKVKSPTRSITFFDNNEQEQYHKVLGCALLMGKDDTKEIEYNGTVYTIFKDIDTDEILKEDTMFFISDHQVFEVLDIMDGIYTLLINNTPITKEDCKRINKIIVTLGGYTTLEWLLYSANKVNAYLDNLNNDSLKERILMIIRWIWFVPYGVLDEKYNEIVNDFNSSKENEVSDEK